MATIASSTANPVLQYPPQAKIDRDPRNGNLWCLIADSATVFQLYKSVNNGTTWAASGVSFTRSNVIEWGGIFINNTGHLSMMYRVNETQGGVQSDVIYYRETDFSTWSAEIHVVHIGNGGVAGAVFKGMDHISVEQPNGYRFVAMVTGYITGTAFGVYVSGMLITPAGTATVSPKIVGGVSSYLITGTTGNIQPSIDFEHNGDAKTSTVPHAWVSFGREKQYLMRGSWVYGQGWKFPAISAIVQTGAVTSFGESPSRWDGARIIFATINATDPTKIDVNQRNKANTTWTVVTSPTHTTGNIRQLAISYNPVTGDCRVFAVGTSTAVLYYVDYIRQTGSWTSWATVTATALLGINDWCVRRGSYANGRYDVATAHATPVQTHTSQTLTYTPNPPTWNNSGTPPYGPSGGAANIAVGLDLDWSFSDPDVNDSQSAYALSRQIGAGALNYWRASDSTWQVAEVQNTSGTTGVSIPSGWGADIDAAYTFKAKVWDQASTPSLYGSGFVVIPSALITTTITQPTAAQVIPTGLLAVAWSVANQSTYRVRIKPVPNPDSINLYDSGTVYDTAARALAVAGVLSNNTSYTVTVQTANSEGLIGVEQSVAFSTVYSNAPTPTLVNTPIVASGVIRCVITNPPSLSGPTTFVSLGTLATGNNASLNPGAPAGKAVGDLLLLYCSIRNSGTGVPNVPSGWTAGMGGNNARMFKRIADGTATDTPTVTFANGAAGDDTIARIACFRGNSGVLTGVTSVLNGSAQNIATPALPVGIDNQLVVTYGWKQSAMTSTTDAPAGTKISDDTSSLGNGSSQEWYYTIQTAHTDMPTGTITVTGGVSAISRGQCISLDMVPTILYQDLYRRVVGTSGTGTRVATGLALNATYDDYTAISGVSYEYQVVAIGSNATSTSSAWTS